MKFKKGDKVIIVEYPNTPSELIGRCVKITSVVDNGEKHVHYWCEDKQHFRYWLYEYQVERPRIFKHKKRIDRKIDKLRAKKRKIK